MPRKIITKLDERSNKRWNYNNVSPSRVVRAFYGDPRHLWNTRRGRNITNIVRNRMKKNQVVMASNTIFGDPKISDKGWVTRAVIERSTPNKRVEMVFCFSAAGTTNRQPKNNECCVEKLWNLAH